MIIYSLKQWVDKFKIKRYTKKYINGNPIYIFQDKKELDIFVKKNIIKN